MSKNNFHNYLIRLGFSEEEVSNSAYENVFSYSPHAQVPLVKYILVKTEREIFDNHLKLWNQNYDNVFIAVGSTQTFIIDTKKKPNQNAILSSFVCINSFNYGINSDGFKDIDVEIISKESINSTNFYRYVQQKQRKKEEVDKDLILNLIALRNDLMNSENEQIIHLLILRCLFVKYLEDRGIFESDFLSNALKSKSSQNLISAFNQVCKINGDVFGSNELSEKDIKVEYLDKLLLFFTTDYQNGQGTLFPYQFNNIPIQLISHVYEAFLKNDTKKGKGIYYTPSFVVNFMLSQSLKTKALENPQLTILDPAVGSGAFLVESFKILRDSLSKKYDRQLNYIEKKHILENQLYGIDTDKDALQITAFSLYLALLEDESPEFIRQEIEHSHPILPSLIGINLMNANTIIDCVFENMKFDFIVSNPPWGSVPSEPDTVNIAEREAIDNKDGLYPEYNNVANYERSQAFLRRVELWQKENTLIVMIVKNSIFLNDKTLNFRHDFLVKNKIETFIELSHYNKILFKKRIIGKIRGKDPVEIGASEPCVIVIFKQNKNNNDYQINYISPKLTKLGEHFELIQHTTNESFFINKNEFIKHDNLWRVLIKGDFEDYKLIQKLFTIKQTRGIICSRGFEATKNMERLSNEPYLRTLIKSEDFNQYQIKRELTKFDWNQKLARRREEDLYSGDKILIAYRPTRNDKFRLRCVQYKEDCVFRNDVLCFKIGDTKNHKAFLGLLNSSLMGYFIYMLSSQWDGGLKREALRTYDIKAFNYDLFPENSLMIQKIIDKLLQSKDTKLIEEIDNIVLDSFDLTSYEKEIIKEFYQVNVDRANEKLKYVKTSDMIEYFHAFKDAFSLVLSPNHTVNASYNISQNIGAIIKITIGNKYVKEDIITDNTLQILQFVKNKQLTETDKLLKEEKIKIYEPQHFYLIKSNQFKDWTKRQAIKDAKEEIELLLSNLPDSNE